MKWHKPLEHIDDVMRRDDERELAIVEALRAIAEELETSNGLLERVVGGKILIGSTDDAGELESVKAAMMNIEPGAPKCDAAKPKRSRGMADVYKEPAAEPEGNLT